MKYVNLIVTLNLDYSTGLITFIGNIDDFKLPYN